MTGCVEGIVERIHRVAVDGLSHPDAKSLLHAYIACLPVPDLCLGILETLAEPSVRRSALRRRLLRLLRDGELQPPDLKFVHDLIEECRLAGRDNPKVRVSVDTLFSSVFAHLPPTQQHSIVQTWIDRGTTGAAGRWLKAVAEVPVLFDERAIMAYYKASDDERAEKLLANRATAAFLEEILLELAERCDRGWVLSKAALRACRVDDAVCRHAPAARRTLPGRRARGHSGRGRPAPADGRGGILIGIDRRQSRVRRAQRSAVDPAGGARRGFGRLRRWPVGTGRPRASLGSPRPEPLPLGVGRQSSRSEARNGLEGSRVAAAALRGGP